MTTTSDTRKRLAEKQPPRPALADVVLPDDAIEAAARQRWRNDHGSINSPDGQRTPEKDEAEKDKTGFGEWDRGTVATAVKDGYRHKARTELAAAMRVMGPLVPHTPRFSGERWCCDQHAVDMTWGQPPTPAPVAAPEEVSALDAVLDEAERIARDQSGKCTGTHCAGCEAGRRVARARSEVARLRAAPRLEPVADPLPSEAVDEGTLIRRTLVALTEQRVIDSAKYGEAPYAPWTIEGVREYLRLVPEDDEDTVRAAARRLIQAYDVAMPEWWPQEFDDLREALEGAGS